MRAIIQRVAYAKVSIDGSVHASINKGLLVLLGIEENDGEEDAEYLSNKISQMRIFSDAEGKMNLSVKDCEGEILLVSQFTLHAQTRKGNRPSFILAARPEKAIPLYEFTRNLFIRNFGEGLKSGVFGADMKIELLNDGPVTIFIDSKNKDA
jgi:D-tyrosyl-tRNA(Tyr) deacylase